MKHYPTHFFLSLGSNLGDKAENIEKALHFLKKIGTIKKKSSLYLTEPVDMCTDSEDFFNLVVEFIPHQTLSPFELLAKIKHYEKQMGRDINHSHKCSRVIDIDILMARNQIIHSKELVIPHKEMTQRTFVLIPFNEIAPDVIHPVLKKSIEKILKNLPEDKKKFRILKINKKSLSD